ncbi:acyl-CoA dehydrogenase family protein [Streptomyces aidingensis]|uniref:Acyl-CoA dehydrogenase n=1 Tax=Streptomyces aidingensis TaxID=910347 RepID=A0A1I1MSI3_9ACTN|nr:acyl-CoA dehydrogenase family protein [Streptomyces aidingensis]SFC88331.1 Acyl-CoA dehydrogenase [Streptomyces aidingensis]
MTGFDSRVRAVRDRAREAAGDLRARALSIDTDPRTMAPHLDSEVYAAIRHGETPEEYRWGPEPPGAVLPDRHSCLQNVVGMCELARGDVGALLACPAPGLAGTFVEFLGSEEQKKRFYERVADGRTWTFFAMTEPGRGSDATAMESRLVRDGQGGWLLHGTKRYIGNGARGGIGVVFARTRRSALSVRAALVELPVPGWRAEPLDMVGLRGAALSEIRLDAVPVPGHMLLGEHLPATRRGIWGAVRTFNTMRLRVAAAAVGTALAMAAYVREHRPGAPGARRAVARAEAARSLVYEAAARIDRDPDRGYLSCAAKLGATRMAVETAHWAAAALGPAGLLDHPLLEKWTRDVCAFEFMEGTGNIQRLHVARGYRSGEADG